SRLVFVTRSDVRPEHSKNPRPSFRWVRPNGTASVPPSRSSTSRVPVKNSSKGFSPNMSERKTIFLTGATGFLGSHLAARLLEQGHQRYVLARSSTTSPTADRRPEVLREAGVSELRN